MLSVAALFSLNGTIGIKMVAVITGLVMLTAGIAIVSQPALQLRYGSAREVILALVCALSHVNMVVVTDIPLARQVLRASNTKGPIIERLFATEAWAPVLSLESVDGEQWQRMRANFDLFHRSMASRVQQLPALITRNVRAHLKAGIRLDANAIVALIVGAFMEWIFEKPVFDPTQHAFVLEAIATWRMAIAQKGAGNMQVKLQTIAWVKTLIRDSKHFDLFGERWMEPEYYSVIMQPFLVSPAINFLDIAVAVQDVYESDLETDSGTSSNSEPDDESSARTTTKMSHSALASLIDRAMHDFHPFPILERHLHKGIHGIPDNTVVFIPTETMLKGLTSADPNVRSFAFGAGDRACPGMLIANRVLVALLEEMVGHPLFCPKVGHEYSGRQNDNKDSIVQVLYQVQRVLGILVRLLWNPKNQVYSATIVTMLILVAFGYVLMISRTLH